MLLKKSLDIYIGKLKNLKRATVNGIKAPHKPILLLSVIQSFETGEIIENKICISPQLVARFKDNWSWLVTESAFKPNFSLPFYHLTSDKFWHLTTYPGRELLLTSSLSIKSLTALNQALEFAYLDEPLYELLKLSETRHIIKSFILEHYFLQSDKTNTQYDLIEDITDQILTDSSPQYRLKVARADEEEIFIRSAIFKRIVPLIYNYTCAITGMRIDSPYDIQMVDACHIVPFAQTHDDTIKNGISLCPNLHRAFDSGLLTINGEYKVIISKYFTSANSTHDIRQYDGQQILLPADPNYQPSIVSLEWHLTRRFKK